MSSSEKSYYLVAGLGQTGYSIAAFLKRRHLPFIVFDTRQQVDGLVDFMANFPDVEIFLETLPTTIYANLIKVIASPGVTFEPSFWQEVQQRQIPVIGDLECLVQEITAPVIAITGTNGKSTVTTLVGEMAKAAGLSVAVAGNIGIPVLDLLDDKQHYDLWVLELSSFQLDLAHSLAPIAATILNVAPDHLDRHGSMSAYIAAKQTIYQHAKTCVFNRQDAFSYPKAFQQVLTTPSLISFGLETIPINSKIANNHSNKHWGLLTTIDKTYLAYGDVALIATDELGIKGQHNWQNALAACALASCVGINHTHMVNVLRSFKGLPHRCQWLRQIDGVDWINDSKGTNIGATISAISGIGQGMSGQIILIAGGLGKGANFNELAPLVTNFCRAVVLIGQDAYQIDSALQGICPLFHAQSLADAVTVAQSQAQSGDVVLLSPACASQDMFRDFNHRGDMFIALVDAL